jgi:hypothetical protein
MLEAIFGMAEFVASYLQRRKNGYWKIVGLWEGREYSRTYKISKVFKKIT